MICRSHRIRPSVASTKGECQLESLLQQLLEHYHQQSIIIDRLFGFGRYVKTFGIEPGGAARYLVRPYAPGTHNAALYGHVFGLEPAVSRVDSRGTSIRDARPDRSDFKPLCHSGLAVNFWLMEAVLPYVRRA
jgi:hypothetical protein